MNMDGAPRICELCARTGVQKTLRVFQLNDDEAVFMCPSLECPNPMGEDGPQAFPTLIKRHITQLPVKQRGKRLRSRSASTSSSRSQSPAILQNGQPLKFHKPAPKPISLATVNEKLMSHNAHTMQLIGNTGLNTQTTQSNGNTGLNSLPRFTNTVLAGRGKGTKRVNPSSTNSPPHSPDHKVLRSSYVPRFAPTELVKSAKKLDFDAEKIPNNTSSMAFTGSFSTSDLSQNEMSCIPDYLSSSNTETHLDTSKPSPVPDLDLSVLSELPDIFGMKSPKKESPEKKRENGTHDIFATTSSDHILSSPPKPGRVSTPVAKTVTEAKPSPLPKLQMPSNPTRSTVPDTQPDSKTSQSPAVSKPPGDTIFSTPVKSPTPRTDEPPQTGLQAAKSFCHVQWSNKDALCWLDVSMSLLVHSRIFHGIVTSRPKGACPIVRRLLDDYARAQSLLKQALEFKRCQLLGQTRSIILDTSVGMVAVKTGGGDATNQSVHSRIPTTTAETLVMKTSVSPLLPRAKLPLKKSAKSNPQPDMPSPRLEVTTQQLQNRSDELGEAARKVLLEAREAVWRFLHPKLQTKKGENDSPVFALPLLLGEDPGIKQRLMNHFEWRMTCDQCGHKHVDKVSKLLVTFPAVPQDFSMRAPYFLRPCFSCLAPAQRLCLERPFDHAPLPELLVAHFVEGVHRAPQRYDFFLRGGHVYEVTGVVQYRHKPDHFVAWIRHPRLNLWMELDDLKHSIVRYSSTAPSFPPSQVHLLMWSRKSVESNSDTDLLYMSPPRALVPPPPPPLQPTQPVNKARRKKPAAPKAPKATSAKKSPLRSALRSPHKKPQGAVVTDLLTSTNGPVLPASQPQESPLIQAAEKCPPTVTTKPKRVKRLRVKKQDFEPQDMAKTLLKKFSVDKFRKDHMGDSVGQSKQQFQGYIPKTQNLPQELQIEINGKKDGKQKNVSKSVCFKSRTPTPELNVATEKKSKAYLSLVHKQLQKIDAGNITNTTTLKKPKKTVANSGHNTVKKTLNGLQVPVTSNGIESSSMNGYAPMVANMNGVSSMNGDMMTASNGVSGTNGYMTASNGVSGMNGHMTASNGVAGMNGHMTASNGVAGMNDHMAASNGVSGMNGHMTASNGVSGMNGHMTASNGVSGMNGHMTASNGMNGISGMNGALSGTDSNSMANSMSVEEVLGDLCKDLNIPDLNVEQVNKSIGFSMEDIEIFFDEAEGQASNTNNQNAEDALDQFDLDMFT